MPEVEANLPAISIVHLGGNTAKSWQGNRTGGGTTGASAFGLMDISCWVSRGDQDWNAQLRTLRAYVQEIFAGVVTLPVTDYLTDTDNPTSTGFRLVFGDLDGQNTAPDPNPDIERARFQLRYDWTIRGSNA